MKLSSIKYLAFEGIRNTWANRLMTLASVGVLVACMTIMGLAVLISENVNLAIGNLEEQNVVIVSMKDYNWALYENDEKDDTASATQSTAESGAENTTQTPAGDKNGINDTDYIIHDEKEAKALCAKIEKLDNVLNAEYVSSEKGLEDAKHLIPDDMKDDFAFLDEENPMSCAAKVTMRDMAKFDETIKQIEKLEGVASITSQSEMANTINALKKGIGVAGFWIIAILVIIALVIVSNTIRITMYSRKLEISIMKAVGATDAFVRIPFVVEGMIIGLISAVISEILLYFCYRIATETIVKSLGTVVKYGDMAFVLFLMFAAIGIFAGVIGSAIMIGKYLKHEGSEFAAI